MGSPCVWLKYKTKNEDGSKTKVQKCVENDCTNFSSSKSLCLKQDGCHWKKEGYRTDASCSQYVYYGFQDGVSLIYKEAEEFCKSKGAELAVACTKQQLDDIMAIIPIYFSDLTYGAWLNGYRDTYIGSNEMRW